ncbi:MAG: DMT family transporter [SAR202 cluster bacterium]|jgi:drug/metabolite transporter (DMT)-like permease|nr:DMT family transporter [SAR202 cluster bacterium]MDP6300719.1 DMT family transporter [SAR202 cluster bacterium]MDP7103582.1 DMT family transporter [SAR202 cluster bacterium]MDP7223968.1 DMT family transporter [SAR202 cluster bacterium]MDP7412021.1 DMT family transporter [SAR202 cluster bacterium]
MTTASAGRRLWLGYAASLGAAACYGSVAVVGRKIVSDFAPPIVATSFSMMFGTAIVLAVFGRYVNSDMKTAPGRAWLFAGAAGLAAAWGVSNWYLALGEAPVVLVAPLVGTSPLVSILMMHLFLQRLEKVTWRTVFGAMMVVGGVVLVALGNR